MVVLVEVAALHLHSCYATGSGVGVGAVPGFSRLENS